MRFTFDLALDRDLDACLVQIWGQCAFCATFQDKGKGHNFYREYFTFWLQIQVMASTYIYVYVYVNVSFLQSGFKVPVIKKKIQFNSLDEKSKLGEHHQILTSSRQRSE